MGSESGMQNLVGKYIEFLVKDPEIPRKIAVFTRAAIALLKSEKFCFLGPAFRNFEVYSSLVYTPTIHKKKGGAR